jgi:hypothetical protein
LREAKTPFPCTLESLTRKNKYEDELPVVLRDDFMGSFKNEKWLLSP